MYIGARVKKKKKRPFHCLCSVFLFNDTSSRIKKNKKCMGEKTIMNANTKAKTVFFLFSFFIF